jgi:hypothetical protein
MAHYPSRGNKAISCWFILVLIAGCVLSSGCQEAETLWREVNKRVKKPATSGKSQFVPSEGMTLRPCSLYQVANPNSEVIRKLPSETPVYLMDRVSEWYRVRTRDGREGYVERKMVGGQEIIAKTLELRRSIEGMPPQGEGVTKSRANFRLDPGREQEVIEIFPPGKRFEVYERVVTLRSQGNKPTVTRGKPEGDATAVQEDELRGDENLDEVRKDVWYKVKMEDGRVGYLYTHNMQLTPPEDIARAVPFMRMVAWRSLNITDDPERGAQNNYLVAYAPIGKDAGSDYTRLYMMTWSPKLKRRVISFQMKLSGVLPVANYQAENKPGFSVRYLHPTKKDKLILASFIFFGGKVKKMSEEEIPSNSVLH